MRAPFTNVHMHVFNSRCAPDRFLRIMPIPFVRKFSGPIKKVIDTRFGRTVIHGLAKLFLKSNSNQRSEVDKYVAFLDTGTNATQLEVFQAAYETGRKYDSTIRIVGLTMNMDYMDNHPSARMISVGTQLQEVKDIKRYYPANFFPFLGIDPRHKSDVNMLNWARNYFETGIEYKRKDDTGNEITIVYPYFSGIKLYPALGFFPFDPKLKELYGYAEKNRIPIMSHCTRVGSQYIGSAIESLIPKEPDMIMPAAQGGQAQAAKQEIIARIGRFYKKGWVKNSKTGDNDNACDLFGHPQNYIPLLETFPELKICLAHMGGSNEIARKVKSELKEIRETDGHSWFELISEMMKKYPNLYTDISYTLGDLGNDETCSRIIDLLNETDINGNSLSDRVLFGTDFFMTEQEYREVELYEFAKTKLAKWFDKLTRDNPQRYLEQPV